MNRSEAIARLREHETELKWLGVQHLYLFGSTARDDAREGSDIDLFFDYEKEKLGLFELMDVKEAAAKILGRKTDIMTRDSIHKVLRQRIEAAAVPVFQCPIAPHSPHLDDIVEAIDRVRQVLADLPLDAFETDWQKQ